MSDNIIKVNTLKSVKTDSIVDKLLVKSVRENNDKLNLQTDSNVDKQLLEKNIRENDDKPNLQTDSNVDNKSLLANIKETLTSSKTRSDEENELSAENPSDESRENKIIQMRKYVDILLNEQNDKISAIFESVVINDTIQDISFEEVIITNLIKKYYQEKDDYEVAKLLKIVNDKIKNNEIKNNEINEMNGIFAKYRRSRLLEWISKIYTRIKDDTSGKYLSFLSYQEIKILKLILNSLLDESEPVFWTQHFLEYIYDKMKNIQYLYYALNKRFIQFNIQSKDLLIDIIVLYFSSITNIFIFKKYLTIAREHTKMNVNMDYRYFEYIENYRSHTRNVAFKSYKIITDTINHLYKTKRKLEINFIMQQWKVNNMIINMKTKNMSIFNPIKLDPSLYMKSVHLFGRRKQRFSDRIPNLAYTTYKTFRGMFGGKTRKRKNKKTRKQRK